MTDRKSIGWLLALVFLASLNASLMTLHFKNIAPWSCPAEDSCRADYRNGSWHVERYDDPDGPQFYSHSRPADWPAMKIVAG